MILLSEYYFIVRQHGKDILTSPSMRSTMNYKQHGKVSVYEHSVLVAIMCLKISHKFRLRIDESVLVRGALLHDYFLYDWHIPSKEHKWHGFIHAKRSLMNAERDFSLCDIERNMIISHMFPLNLCLPRYKESVILCIADKICASKEIFHNFISKLKGWHE